MKRTLVQFDEPTYRRLRDRAFRQQRSMASLVRELVARGLDADEGRARPRRVADFVSVKAGRSKQGRLSPVSEKHDAALAAAFDE
jgi:hypothetical protein